jgi:hypothetical protein
VVGVGLGPDLREEQEEVAAGAVEAGFVDSMSRARVARSSAKASTAGSVSIETILRLAWQSGQVSALTPGWAGPAAPSRAW